MGRGVNQELERETLPSSFAELDLLISTKACKGKFALSGMFFVFKRRLCLLETFLCCYLTLAEAMSVQISLCIQTERKKKLVSQFDDVGLNSAIVFWKICSRRF